MKYEVEQALRWVYSKIQRNDSTIRRVSEGTVSDIKEEFIYPIHFRSTDSWLCDLTA
jgi:hypothetical protein